MNEQQLKKRGNKELDSIEKYRKNRKFFFICVLLQLTIYATYIFTSL